MANKLKKITTVAKQLYKTGKFAKWTDAIKAASKKISGTSSHKDTKSHNVNIRVVSGLPSTFRGLYGPVKFRIVKQYDIYGKINAVLEDIDKKINFLTIDGSENATVLAEQFHKYIVKNDSDFNNADMKKETLRRMTKFFIQLNKDVKDENRKAKTNKSKTNKSKPVINKKVEKKLVSTRQTGTSVKEYDERKQALSPGKRTSETGRTYYEYRANRSDKGVLLGFKKISGLENVSPGAKKVWLEINKKGLFKYNTEENILRFLYDEAIRKGQFKKAEYLNELLNDVNY